MKSPGTPGPPGAPQSSVDEEGTGLPGFKTWPAVYLFVLATFVVWVVLLAALTGILLMNPLDYLVLFGTMLGIAAYGVWRTRGQRGLSGYLKGSGTTGWVTIGLSVMATQASAITFISTPGQGYEDGLGFVQNYFGMPLALIIVAAVFLPMFRRLNVYTAYEFLGRRFDTKTRLLGAGLFLLQRGLGAGITIYAPGHCSFHRVRMAAGTDHHPQRIAGDHLHRDGRQ